MKLYNTLSKEKELFTPIDPKKVRMYHCGPTVYDYVHIGNLRSFLLADFLRRSFEYLGYKVTQVMNITDVGHLVSDGDHGDDKMTKALKRQGKDITIENMLAVADFYSAAFKKDMSSLNILMPHHIPRASDYIDGNIELIQMLEKKSYTYQTSDGVYFDTSKMPDYGVLGGISQENTRASRTEINTEKRQQSDFALWKFDDERGWDSPWGQGFPGWHIECSTMSRHFLGDHFDIHTGGLDNAPIHHNNEIAQSTCATGAKFVNYWLHGAMLNFGGKKLSKSTGGNITLKILKEKNYLPLAYRYLALQTHYHSPMNFTWDILASAQSALEKIYREIIQLREKSNTLGKVDKAFQKSFAQKISDDLNLPQGLAVFHDVLKSKLFPQDKLATLYDFDRVLGLGLSTYTEETIFIPKNVQKLLDKRKQARAEKDFQHSDVLRDAINDLGYTVSDSDGEQKISKKTNAA